MSFQSYQFTWDTNPAKTYGWEDLVLLDFPLDNNFSLVALMLDLGKKV